MIAISICAVLLLGGAYGIAKVLNGITPVSTPQSDVSSDTELSVPSLESSELDEDRIIYGYEAVFADAVYTGDLVLVNREVATEDKVSGLVSIYEHKNDHYKVKDMNVMLLESCMEPLNRMMDDFYAATGIDAIHVLTGYRTKAYQNELYQDNLDNTETLNTPSETAKAGHSEHETGLAIDINIYENGAVSTFDGTGDYAWLVEHCTDYGFLQRYPEDKVDITQFAAEPWHFRYVGVPHAEYMTEQNLVLEEYLELLRKYTYAGDHLEITTKDKQCYEVYYVPFDTSVTTGTQQVPVPTDLDYTLSGNNTDGFIVTVHIGTAEDNAADSQISNSSVAEPTP